MQPGLALLAGWGSPLCMETLELESDSELGWRYSISAFLTGSQVMPRLMVCGLHIEYLQSRSALLQFVGTSASLDFNGASDSKVCLQCGRPGFDPWVGKIPCRRERLCTPVFCPGEFHGLQSDMTE